MGGALAARHNVVERRARVTASIPVLMLTYSNNPSPASCVRSVLAGGGGGGGASYSSAHSSLVWIFRTEIHIRFRMRIRILLLAYIDLHIDRTFKGFYFYFCMHLYTIFSKGKAKRSNKAEGPWLFSGLLSERGTQIRSQIRIRIHASVGWIRFRIQEAHKMCRSGNGFGPGSATLRLAKLEGNKQFIFLGLVSFVALSLAHTGISKRENKLSVHSNSFQD